MTEGLIHKQNLWFIAVRAGNPYTLPHAAGKLGRKAVFKALQSHQIDIVLRFFPALLLGMPRIFGPYSTFCMTVSMETAQFSDRRRLYRDPDRSQAFR